MVSSVYHVVPKANWQSKEQKFLPSSITPDTELAPGQVLTKLSSFNIAANNVTYAVIGELFGYWGYFPDPVDKSLGRVPVWGFADIVKSAVPQIKEGTRVYGYFPMATYHILKLKPSPASADVLEEVSEHRLNRPKLYQRYNIMPTGKKGSKDEALYALFYIPVLTAYAMTKEIAPPPEEGRTVVIVSPSSKTGTGLAQLLKSGPWAAATKTIGLSSSASSKEYATSLGYYDDVFTYSEMESVAKKLSSYPGKVILYDFAGDGERLAALQRAAGEKLDRTVRVGFTDWQTGGAGQDKLIRPSELFNLPMEECLETHVKNAGGLDAFGKEFDKVFARFLSQIGDKVKIEWKQGPEAVAEKWNSMLGDERAPEKELILEV